jgi:hypothetical protein
MPGIRERGDLIRHYIVLNLEDGAADIVNLAVEKFKISRQAVNKHLKKLCEENLILPVGVTRNRKYSLVSTEYDYHYLLNMPIAEDVVWKNDIRKHIEPFSENVFQIWFHGFSEMFNNAIDHSEGKRVSVFLKQNVVYTEMLIMDDGVGIFKKIQNAMGLLDERHAILELSKGKLTTDPSKHSGEGIFFTSRMFDSFDILSGGVYFTHKSGLEEDWILERLSYRTGTSVWMKLLNDTNRTTREVFDRYSSGDDYGFTHTVVPVDLIRYGNDQLVSRSQAKRLLARVELFQKVILDFSGVDAIGQAFADQIFRVFANENPGVELIVINSNNEIDKMIQRAKTSNIQS